MIRKWMTTLLCLMLALALPLCAMADTQTTMQITLGDELVPQQAIKDLFDTLSFTLTGGDKAGALTVNVANTGIVSIAGSVDENALYLGSELLGETVYYIGWDDLFTLMDAMVASSAEGDELAAAQQSMEQLKTTVMALVSGEALPAQSTDMEANKAAALAQFDGDPAMQAWLQTIMDKVVVENGQFAAEGRDVAAVKSSMTMTAEDLLPLFDTDYMRNSVKSSLQSSEENMTAEELEKAADQALAQSRQVIADSGFLMTMEAYSDEASENLIGMDMKMDMTIKEDGEVEGALVMLLDYDRLTTATGVSHKGNLSMNVSDDDDETMTMQGQMDLLSGGDLLEGNVALLVEGTEITLHFATDEAAGAVSVALYQRNNATSIIEPAASARPLITFTFTTGESDGAVLSKVKAANVQNAVNILTLSGDDMQALGEAVQSNAMSVLFQALSLMPSSVMQLLTSAAQ